MLTPAAFPRFFAKAILNAVGGGVAGDFVVEVLPDVARDVWAWWGNGRPEDQLRAEIQEIAQLTPQEAEQQAAQIMSAQAANTPEPVLRLVTSLVARVPAAVRASQAAAWPIPSADAPCSPRFGLRGPTTCCPSCPHHLPRFHEGQKPIPGIDWELVEPLGVGGFGEVWRARNPFTWGQRRR